MTSHTRPMSCAPPAEPDATYRMTPAQELDLADHHLRWVLACYGCDMPSPARRWLREVLRAIKSAREGLGS